METEAIATHFEVGKYYQVPIVEMRITHVPTGVVMENEQDAQWHCAHKGYSSNDFKTEEIDRAYLPFRIDKITAWDDTNNEINLTSDAEYRENLHMRDDIEYEFTFATEKSIYVEADFLTNSIEVSDIGWADECFEEYWQFLSMQPDEPYC